MQLRPLLLALSLPLLGSCVSMFGRAPVSFSSEPPGARVVIDGVDSGFATPCVLAIPRGKSLRLELALDGYDTATRFIGPGIEVWTVEWNEMLAYPNTWRFPLWLNTFDFWRMVRVERMSNPSRVFVALRRSADP